MRLRDLRIFLVGSGPGNSIAFRPFEKWSTALPRLFFKCTGKTVEVDRRRLGLDPRQTKELDLVDVALPERSEAPVQDGRTVVSVAVAGAEVEVAVEVEVRSEPSRTWTSRKPTTPPSTNGCATLRWSPLPSLLPSSLSFRMPSPELLPVARAPETEPDAAGPCKGDFERNVESGR